MSNKRRTGAIPRLGSSDPRDFSGPGIIGGSPHDRGTAIIAATKAVLLDHTTVCEVDTRPVDGGAMQKRFAMTLDGRINKSPDRASITYLFDADGAAALITQLYALAARSGIAAEFAASVQQRLADLDAEGNREHRGDPADAGR